MAKSIDQQIKDAMAKEVVGHTTEIYKAVVLALYKRITAHSLQVGIAYGSPVLTGRYEDLQEGSCDHTPYSLTAGQKRSYTRAARCS
jgi:hypothetical protein